MKDTAHCSCAPSDSRHRSCTLRPSTTPSHLPAEALWELIPTD